MSRIERIAIICFCLFLFSAQTRAQAVASYLFLDVVDSNKRPVINATVEGPAPTSDERTVKQTDKDGRATFQYWMRIPDLSMFRVAKPDYYPFDLLGLLRGVFTGTGDSFFRTNLTVELLKIPGNKAERDSLGREQVKREFFSAVLAGNAAKVRELLRSKIDPNISTDDLRGVPHPKGVPAMLYAADNADIKTMNAFLAAGVDLRRRDSSIGNILAFYIGSSSWNKTYQDTSYAERLNFVNSYLDTLLNAGASLNATNTAGQTLLTIAAGRGDLPLMEMLLRRGVSINAKNKYGSTTLMDVSAGSNTGMIEFLLRSGADPNIVTDAADNCSSPLISAVERGDIDRVKMLLSYRANANFKCRDGANALSRVRWRLDLHYRELLKALIEAGADAGAPGAGGVTPLMSAVEAGDMVAVRMLLGKGASVNARDRLGRTALMFSIQGLSAKPDLEMVDLLLRSGANPNITIDGETHESFGTALSGAVWHEPLYCVLVSGPIDCWYRNEVQYASEDIVKRLIAAGADVNLTFQNKDTPLVSAAKGGRTAMIRLLTEAGADIKGAQGTLALKAAKERATYAGDRARFQEVIELLRALGAKD